MVNNLVIGYGQIGQAVGRVIGEHWSIDGKKPYKIPDEPIDVMHICFPYSEGFLKYVDGYRTKFRPRHIVIWSTVPIGTTKKLKRAVHSPVEGKHPELSDSLRQGERWIGCNSKADEEFFVEYFSGLGLHTRTTNNSDHTEALKLLSTSEYGINLVFANYKGQVADVIGMDHEVLKEWNRSYNRLYKNLGLDDKFQKFVLDSPNFKIGGHCIVPNAEILNSQEPHPMLEMIGRFQ